MNIIRHIIAVDRVSACNIVDLRSVAVDRVTLSEATRWENLKIKVPARLTLSNKIDNGVRIYSAKLTFRTCEEFENLDRYVYRCKTTNGKFILIGSDERPYPITTTSEDHPENFSDSQLNEVSVSYNSKDRFPYII